MGLTWIVERTFAWIGRYRRMSKDYEHRVQTSETLIDLIAIRLMLNRLTKCTGSRIVLLWFAIARLIDCLIHQAP